MSDSTPPPRPLDDDPDELRARIAARRNAAASEPRPGRIARIHGEWCILTEVGDRADGGGGQRVSGLPLDVAASAIASLVEADDEDWRPPPRLIDAVLSWCARRLQAGDGPRGRKSRKARPRRRP